MHRCAALYLRSAGQWVAFARLEPFVTSVMHAEYDTDSGSWPDTIKTFFRDFWVGEHDVEILKASNSMSAHYDAWRTEMTKALRK